MAVAVQPQVYSQELLGSILWSVACKKSDEIIIIVYSSIKIHNHLFSSTKEVLSTKLINNENT